MIKQYLASNEPDWNTMQTFEPQKVGIFDYSVEEWKEMLQQPLTYIFELFQEAGAINIKNLPTFTPLKQLFSDHVGKLVTVEGKVVAISDPDIVPLEIAYVCQNCNTVTSSGTEPKKCNACGEKSFNEDLTKSHFDDLQFLKIHELKPTNNQIAKLTIRLAGKESIWKVRAGQKIRSTGTFTLEKDLKLKKYYKRLEAGAIEALDYRDAEFLVTADDITRFQKEIDQPQFYDKLRASFAPFIIGVDEVKDACILTMASVKTSRPLNLLLVGDPAKAKSVLLEYMTALAENGQFASAASVTWAGLSVTSEKDHETESWILKYGALPLADEGLFCFDEFQNMSEIDTMKLNEVLESKKISYAKAGGNSGELPARCAVVIACNPHYGKWLKKTNIQENLKFIGRARDAFISRMALIFILPDEADDVMDKQVAQAILKHSGDDPMKKYYEDWTADGIEYFGTKSLKKLFSWITSKPVPEVPESLYPELIEFYSKERNDIDNKLMGLITPRYLKDAIRLAQMKARVLGKATIDKSDVDFAYSLLNRSLNESAFDPKTGKADGNIIAGSKSESETQKKENKEAAFWDAYELARVGKEFALSKDWIHILVSIKNWKQEEAEKWIAQADAKGKIYGAGEWRRV